jgi:phosphopantetheinyl transferase
MPLYKSINPNPGTIVKIWEITESYEELLSPLTLKAQSLERVLRMKSQMHQKGFLSVRHLLRVLGYTDQDLFYNNLGKPYLKDGKYISITHSYTFSAVIVSDHPVGIDIEMQREKIAKIAPKFVDYECEYLDSEDQDYIKKLTIIWAIKESLYKLFATPGMLFKDHFLVIPFMLQDLNTQAWIDYKGLKQRYDCEFLEFDSFTCAYTK